MALLAEGESQLVSRQGRRSNSVAERVVSAVEEWVLEPTAVRTATLEAVGRVLEVA